MLLLFVVCCVIGVCVWGCFLSCRGVVSFVVFFFVFSCVVCLCCGDCFDCVVVVRVVVFVGCCWYGLLHRNNENTTENKLVGCCLYGLFVFCFFFVVFLFFVFPCGLCSGLFSLLLGVMPCSLFFCVLCCLCCGVCLVCVVVVRMVVVGGCRWSGLFYRNNETQKNMLLLLI